jgi:RimJ/RimL family protein N-acetyltransferase
MVDALRRLFGAEEQIETERLVLRRPVDRDAQPIFDRYAADPEVTRYLAWPRHVAIEDAQAFLGYSHAEWRQWGCGPYLAYERTGGRMVGSTGLAFESRDVASTGYVLARDAWGAGYATEMLRTMIVVARRLGLRRLYAVCHVDHLASARVMEKGGLVREGVLRRHTVFPNLGPERADVLCYALRLSGS